MIEYIKIPTHCPYCNSELKIINNNGVRTLNCINNNCSAKLVNITNHFCSKEHGLDVKGLSKATIEKLINWGWVNSISDIFLLSTFSREWKNQPGFGEKSVDNILTAIESAKHTTLEAVIAGIGIPLIGRTAAKALANNFHTWGNFRFAVDNWDFEDLDGFGPEMNRALKEFDYTEIDYIVENFLTIEETDAGTGNTTSLEGKTFVITGKLSRKRDDIKTDIENAGGKVTGSVSSKTNYLVCNDKNSTTGKSADAKKLGIPVITEEELMGMLK